MDCLVSKEKYLGNVFRIQVESLLRDGFHELAQMTANEFQGMLEELISLLPNVRIEPGDQRVPFLIVIPDGLIPALWQWLAFKDNGKRSRLELKTEDFRNQVSGLPRDEPYLTTVVDEGERYSSYTAVHLAGATVKLGKSLLSVNEGLALLRLKPSILKAHHACCAGSRCADDPKRLPFCRYSVDGPVMGSMPEDEVSEDYGFPTCLSRLYTQSEPDHPWDGPT